MNFKKEVKNFKSFTHQDFASMLYRYKYRLNVGDITGGTIFSQEKKGFLVDIGENVAAYLPEDEIRISEYKKTRPFINNSREFFIVAYNRKIQRLILSIKRLEYIRGWQRIKQINKEDAVITIKINKINRGGLITAVEGVRGFIPNSHTADIQDKKSLINQKINCQPLFINERTNTIILSHKRATLKKLLPKIYIGKHIAGVIKQIRHYGAFIDIYGFIALLHVSEIADENLKDVNTFHVGNQIAVQIIHIDTKQGRLSVSTKNLG